MITASKYELASKCAGAFALPQTEERSEWNDAGDERHAEQEAQIVRGEVPEDYAARWPGLTWRAEVAFAYDVSTGEGRELGVGIKRNYGQLGPFEIPGTADVVGIGADVIVIGDRKSFDPNVSRPEHNGQLKLLALAACRAHDRERADIAIQHEVRPFEVAQLDALDLDSMAAEARDVLLSAARAAKDFRAGLPIPLVTGKHCRWCAAFNDCPKQKDLVQLVTTNAADNQVELLLPLADDESAANAHEFAQRLRMLLKRIEAAVYARAAERPFMTRTGKMFGKVVTQGNEKLDGDVVYEVIKTKYGQSIADTAVIRSATKTRIKEALGFVGAKSVAAAEKEVLAEVRAKGGSKRETKEVIEEYVPAQQLKAANE